MNVADGAEACQETDEDQDGGDQILGAARTLFRFRPDVKNLGGTSRQGRESAEVLLPSSIIQKNAATNKSC